MQQATILEPTSAEANAPSRPAWLFVYLLAGVNLINYVDRMALSALLPAIQGDLGLSDTEVGGLAGLAFASTYAMFGLPIGWLSDRVPRKAVIASALALWSGMTAICGITQNFLQLFAARMGVGVGEAGCFPPSQSLICDYVPIEQRSLAFSIHTMGSTVGLMVGLALAGWLGAVVGWRWTLISLGLPGLVLALLVVIILREPERGRHDGSSVATIEARNLLETISALAGHRTVALLGMYLVLTAFFISGVQQWLPSFYIRNFAMSSADAGGALGAAIGFGSLAGLLIGGLLSKLKRYRTGPASQLRLLALFLLTCLPLYGFAILTHAAELSIAAIGLTALCWSVPAAAVFATLYTAVRASQRAFCSSAVILLQSIVGWGLAPFAVGVASDLLRPAYGEAALRLGMLVPPIALPLASFLLLLAYRSSSSAAGETDEVRP